MPARNLRWLGSTCVEEGGDVLNPHRAPAWGMRLDIPAGDAVRWLPGEVKRVRLVAYGGRGIVRGFNRLTEGPGSPARLAEGLERVRLDGYGHHAAKKSPYVGCWINTARPVCGRRYGS
jgi:Urease beta subunit